MIALVLFIGREFFCTKTTNHARNIWQVAIGSLLTYSYLLNITHTATAVTEMKRSEIEVHGEEATAVTEMKRNRSAWRGGDSYNTGQNQRT